MSSAGRRPLLHLLRSLTAAWTTPEVRRVAQRVAIGSAATATALYCLYPYRPIVHAASIHPERESPDVSGVKKLSSRELRFLRFASVEYNGQIFMTPRDFLDSLTQEQPRNRLSRRVLSDEHVQKILRKTPPFRKGSKRLFRDLDHKGLLSYTEYLFLLSVLTKPHAGFRIAFNMFDMDGNEKVDKNEFLVIQVLINSLRADGKIARLDEFYLENLMSRSSRLVKAQKDSGDVKIVCEENKDDSSWNRSQAVPEPVKIQDTTLLLHFFGLSGTASMSFEDFQRFYDNLLEELLEIEFQEFAKGRKSISEMDFARILLRYTIIHAEDYSAYLQRIHDRIPEERGITYEQFRDFCMFLNDFDDFTIAVKLYTLSDLPVSQAEFSRAVRCATGYALDAHVVDTVFKIFDVNDNGELSYSEFISIMKDRIHRGFKSHAKKQGASGWNGFKQCVSQELKKY